MMTQSKQASTQPDTKPWFVYILRCSDKYFYTGISPDVKNRVIMHRKGAGARFTRGKAPLVLVYVKKYCNLSEAAVIERTIKKKSKKAKEQLVAEFAENITKNGDAEILDLLSVNNI